MWEYNPEIVVIGTGSSGKMKVSGDVEDFCSEKEIRLIVLKTAEAVIEFNVYSGEKKTACGLHLTC